MRILQCITVCVLASEQERLRDTVGLTDRERVNGLGRRRSSFIKNESRRAREGQIKCRRENERA